MLNRIIFLLFSFYSFQSFASSPLETAKNLETSIVSKFHSSVFEFGGNKTKSALQQKIKLLLPPSDFHNNAGYYKRFSTHLYMLSTARLELFNNKFDLTKVSSNWLNYYNNKLRSLENFLSDIIEREKKKYAAMNLSFTYQHLPFDHWSSHKDSI